MSALQQLIRTLAAERAQVIALWKHFYADTLGADAHFSPEAVEPWLAAEFDTIVAALSGGSETELGPQLQETGRKYAEVGVPYGELVISMNLFEEACASVLKQQAADPQEQLKNSLLLDKLSHFRLIQLAQAYFDRYVERIQDSHQELAASLAQHESQMLRAEKLAGLGRLAAGVAHEINTPLATIALTVDEVVERAPADAAVTITGVELTRIKKSVEKCKRITSKLLDLARIREPSIQKCNLKELLQTIVDTLTLQARTESKTIALKADPAVVNTDPLQIEHIVLNLLSNALDATSTGGEVIVESGLTEDGFYIEVADKGSGIPPEHLERIFEPFFTTKPPGKGTGLGLPTTNTIVQQLGGQLTVDSSTERGTRMRLRLPDEGEQ